MPSENTTTVPTKPWYRNWSLLLFPVTPLGLFFGFMAYDFAFNGPPARKAQAALEAEFDRIQPPSFATFLDRSASHRAGQALVEGSYDSSRGYPELRRYYDRELSMRGWRFVGETALRDWGRDLGGKEAYYSKGDYTATLGYAGRKAIYGWDYSLSLSWGLYDAETEVHGGWTKLKVPEALFLLGWCLLLVCGAVVLWRREKLSWGGKAGALFLFFLSLLGILDGVYSLWWHFLGK